MGQVIYIKNWQEAKGIKLECQVCGGPLIIDAERERGICFSCDLALEREG